jgi:hypothetical protein
MKWVGYITHIEEIRNAYKIVTGNSEETDHLPRSMWNNNMEADIK